MAGKQQDPEAERQRIERMLETRRRNKELRDEQDRQQQEQQKKGQ